VTAPAEEVVVVVTLTRVRVSGPLQPFADGFREALQQQGYSPWSVMFDLQSMDRLSRWLVACGVDPAKLTAAEVGRFVREDRGSGPDRRRRPRGLSSLLCYLRGLGVVPDAVLAVAEDPLGHLLDEFSRFLIDERGLAAATVWYYRATAKKFLSWSAALSTTDDVEVGQVSAEMIRSFVIDESRWRSIGSVKNVVTALRSLLRFLHLRGYLAAALEDAVPAVAGWRRGLPPATPGMQDIARLLASCDRRTAAGRRDYAILVLLARLGLRIGEVAALTVDDVDWRSGEIVVSGKGNRFERLPLPVDVGRAIAGYCRRGRHGGQTRNVFLHAKAPYGALSGSAVGHVVRRACDRAGLARVGAHRLRHAAATALRQAGAPLFEIGQVLRHTHPVTTAGYGSIGARELIAVALPWPGGAR
jgi:integrase/recombinase XerD